MNRTVSPDQRAVHLRTGRDEDLPIVDAHHHFWDIERNNHPWLRELPRIPFRYGDYGPICRNFLPAEYLRLATGHRVVQTVYMEGEWCPADPLGEPRWVHALARETGLPNAMVGQVWLDRDDVDAVLQGHARYPLVRAVRQKPRVVSRREDYREDFAEPGSMRCPQWRDGYARLARYGLMFELQAPWWHFDEALELAHDFPATTIIVNHTGLPADRTPEGLAGWRGALEKLADAANVHLKISGLGVRDAAWSVATNGPIVRDAIRIFGVERCMFASNFPVDSIVATFDQIYSGFKTITTDLEPRERLRLFHDNAVALYRLLPIEARLTESSQRGKSAGY
ncbi:MAG: amidohydrolase family protein [Burkholderiales bacterium]